MGRKREEEERTDWNKWSRNTPLILCTLGALVWGQEPTLPDGRNQPPQPRVWRKQRPYHLVYPFPSCTLSSSSSCSYTRKTNNQMFWWQEPRWSLVCRASQSLALTNSVAAHREKDWVTLDYGILYYKVSVSQHVLWTIFKNPGPHPAEYSGNSAFLVGLAMFLWFLECLNNQKIFLMPPPLSQSWPNLIIQEFQ